MKKKIVATIMKCRFLSLDKKIRFMSNLEVYPTAREMKL